MNKFRLRAYVFLLITSIISGVAGPVIKLTLRQLPFDVFLFYRFFISSLVIIALLPFAKLHIPKKPSVLIYFLIYGFLNSTVALGLLFLGTSKTTLLDMSLISILGPIATIVVAHYFLRDHLTKRAQLGSFIAIIGAAFIIIGPFLSTGDDVGQISGNVLIIIYLIVGALNSIILKRLLRIGVDPLSLTNMSFFIGFISFFVIILVQGKLTDALNIIKNLPLPYHAGVFYMALMSGTLAYFLGNVAQKSIEVSEAAIFSYIFPVISAIFAVLLLGDKLTLEIVAGSIITFVGVFLAETRKRSYNR